MYKHLLIATDGSELAQRAVDHGLALAKALNAKVTVVMVTEAWTAVFAGEMGMPFPIEDYDKGCAEGAAQILAGVAQAAKRSDVACATLHVKDQFPAEGIAETAKLRSCDLIVMASHGRRGFSRFLLGSQTNNVVTHSSVPVLVCR
jgi:nucleotide-binding universal stress UspA family protein